jgi:amino acid transporter
MLPMATMTFGPIGAVVAIIMLIAAMILVIQTGLLGSAHAMESMAQEGNLPSVFGKQNKHGQPHIALISIAVLNMLLILLGTPTIILAASATGYVFANGITLFAYVKAKRELKGKITAPKWWWKVALVFGFVNIPFYLIGLFMIESNDYGVAAAIFGLIALFVFVPLWFYAMMERHLGETERRLRELESRPGGSLVTSADHLELQERLDQLETIISTMKTGLPNTESAASETANAEIALVKALRLMISETSASAQD